MNLRRGLIGIFTLVFFVSAMTMVTLVIDDNKDLSSRASLGVSSSTKLTSLENQLISSTSAQFEKNLSEILKITINYDPSLWQAPDPKDKTLVFILLSDLSTIKILNSKDFNSDHLYSEVDSSYKLVKKNISQDTVVGWQTSTSQYQFLNLEKYVTYWQKGNLFLVSVQNKPLPFPEIVDFVTKIDQSNPKVKGVSTTIDDSARLATLTRPSVVMILTRLCSQVKTTNLPGLSLSDKTYPFCAVSSGTGFFVTSQGHLATNGHVVQMDTKTALLNAILGGDLKNLLADYLQDFQNQQGSALSEMQLNQKISQLSSNKESLVQLTGAIVQMNQSNFLNLTDKKYQYYIQLGSEPLILPKNQEISTSESIKNAELIDIDYSPISPQTGFNSSDVALLKVEGQNYPALPLGKLDDVSIGSEITLIGYPSVVSGSNSQVLDYSSVTEPTVTKGVVSAFKKAKGDQRTLIQTDASISQGSSGSPAVDQTGKVVGIATYGLTPTEGSGNFNLLRSVEDLKNLLQKNNITPNTGVVYDHWQNALENYWLSYFKFAQTDFNLVKSLDPSHPSVDLYLTKVKEKINSTDDLSPLFNRQDRKLYMTISGISMLVSLFMILGLTLAKNNRSYSPKPIQTFN